jgi:hypothetical protein
MIITLAQITLDVTAALKAMQPLPQEALDAMSDSTEKMTEFVNRIRKWNETDG